MNFRMEVTFITVCEFISNGLERQSVASQLVSGSVLSGRWILILCEIESLLVC